MRRYLRRSVLIATTLVLFTVADEVWAAQLRGGYYACISKDLLHEINTASDSQKEWLLRNGCVVTRSGIEVHDLGFDGFAIKKIRVILQGAGPVILWTPMENVQR